MTSPDLRGNSASSKKEQNINEGVRIKDFFISSSKYKDT